MAVSVVVAVGDAADGLVPLLEDRLARLRVGDGTDPDTDMAQEEPRVGNRAARTLLDHVQPGMEDGNGASIFTRSGAAARRFQHDVTAGMVGVNIPIPVPLSFYSFGGWKDPGR